MTFTFSSCIVHSVPTVLLRWSTNHSVNLSHCDGRMTFTRYEQLRAMKRASEAVGLSRSDVEAMFSGNAEQLIALARE